MKRCKHPLSDRFIETRGVLALPDNLTMVREYCGRCGAWLSLGPSNDVGVGHEIRAAEIAAIDRAPRCNDGAFEERCEGCGWSGHILRAATPQSAWLAGYLARAIVTHGEE